jgi:hypothetical protein
MKRLFLTLPLVLVFVTSGCTIPGTSINIPFLPDIFGSSQIQYTDDIIIIRNLQVTPAATVNEKQPLTVYADIQNIGKPGMANTKTVSIIMYDYCSNLFQTPTAQCSGGAQAEAGIGCKIDLLPQETKTVRWQLTPNNINLATSCTLKLRAAYEHETETVTQMTFIDAQELAAKIRRGESWQRQGTSVIGEGPVKPYLSVEGQQPVSDDTQGSISLKVKNVGHGFVINSKVSDGNLNVPESQGLTVKCGDQTTTGGKIDIPPNYRILIGAESSPLLCTVTADKNEIALEQTFDLSAKIKYAYEFRAETKVTIQPVIEM